jgi:translation initiation factor 4A
MDKTYNKMKSKESCVENDNFRSTLLENSRWKDNEDTDNDKGKYDTESHGRLNMRSYHRGNKNKNKNVNTDSTNIFHSSRSSHRRLNGYMNSSSKSDLFGNKDRRYKEEEEEENEPMARSGDPVPEEIIEWCDANLKEEIVRGIYAYGYENPSPIQSKAISPIVAGRDVIAQAQSGTGKTGAFAISTLEVIDATVNSYQAILLSPTRELAIQSRDVIRSIGDSMNNLKVKLAVGGGGSLSSEEGEVWRRRDADTSSSSSSGHEQIIVGTPGRIYDMINRRIISTKHIKLLILDEADEMLSDGFRSQVHQIFTNLNENIQVVLFSATLPQSVHDITNKFMRDPVNILMKTEMVTLDGISQNYVAVNNDAEKFEVLKDLFEFISSQQCIVYCNSIKRVVDLYQAMLQEDYPVACIHGGQSKDERLSSYKDFKSGSSRVLISTNVTSRGIDVQQVSTVINFDIPNDIHNYIHRIGRSGRWGRKGLGINLITRRDVKKLKEIEEYYSTQINELSESSLVNK